MSQNANNVAASAFGVGIGPLGFLGVAFILAKIFGVAPVASWSWWAVTAPFWGPWMLALVIFVGVLTVLFLKGDLQ
jgi:hypothetical protein